jgi:hypothetical protein
MANGDGDLNAHETRWLAFSRVWQSPWFRMIYSGLRFRADDAWQIAGLPDKLRGPSITVAFSMISESMRYHAPEIMHGGASIGERWRCGPHRSARSRNAFGPEGLNIPVKLLTLAFA